MEQLRNLQAIYSLASDRFNLYGGNDFVLPQIFKDQVKEINSNTITYNKYSAIIETRGNQNGVLNIYLPNQWFYIASYFTDFYNELQKYKSYSLKAISRERLKELNGASLTDSELRAINQLGLDEQSKNYLVKFITDYSWWFGAKTIDRGDFYVSPILNSAKLVNASQSFVADLCAFLSDKKDLVDAIISGENCQERLIKKEIIRQKAAATFMKKAISLTLGRDSNLSRIEALHLYKKTSKQLQINGFYIGRDKNLLPNRIDDVDVNITWEYDSQEYVLYLEWTPESMEKYFFPVYNRAYNGMLQMQKDSNGDYVLYELTKSLFSRKKIVGSLQQIFYGAPGTGKSNTIKREVDDEGKLSFRTTFHPDSDYSTFVGCYKPSVKPTGVTLASGEREEVITYKFVPQAFTNAYVKAWNTEEDVYLIIEEINRGNCAQIFGDLFQLLDRKNGFSEYPIKADTDLAEYLKEELADSSRPDIPEKVKSGKELVLPSNLYIWATMNTSDQSLFPIDSAFKRRWDWKYMPIDTKKETWYIKVGGINYSWTSFLDIVNARVLKATSSEDKQLGFYFCKAEDNIINAETFVSKVLFYLWNDVFKDYDDGESIFKDVDGTKLPFSGFYNTNGTINEPMVTKLLTSLEIEKNNSENLVEPDKVGNNFDRYSLNGSDPKGKSDLGLSIMKQYLSEHPDASFDEIKQVFPDSMLGNVANRGLIVEESIPLDSYTRYYTPELFTSADGIKFRIYKQWIAANIGNIIDFARSQGWNVEQAEQWDRKDNQA